MKKSDDKLMRGLTCLASLKHTEHCKNWLNSQERIIKIRGNLEQKRTWLEEIRDRTSRKYNINIAKTELTKTAEQDHQERRDIWSVPLRLFNDNSQALYEAPGALGN